MTFPRLPFEAVFSDESGGNIKTPQGEYLSMGAFPVVDQGKALVGGYVDDASRLCGGGRPAIVFGDHTRCIKHVDFPFCMGADGVKVLRPKIEADLRYLYYYLLAIKLPEAGYDRHFKYLKRIEVVVPPLPEQRRIAVILDQADTLRAKRREALAQLDQLTQSIFIEMFGDPITYAERYTISELVDVCNKITDGEHGTVERIESGRLYLMARNVTKNLTIDLTEVSFISELDHQRIYKRCNPEPNDLMLVCVGATIGKIALVPEMEEFSLARSVALIKPK